MTNILDKIPPILLVGFGGMIGAILRYLVSNSFQDTRPIPLGTLIVNVIGSFALGAIITLYTLEIIESTLIPLLGIGIMGSFTTMSSFAVETMTLSDESLGLASINLILMVLLVLVGVFLGRLVIYILFSQCNLVASLNY